MTADANLTLCTYANSDVDKPSLWYVAYTYPRHEKAIVESLKSRWVETFLPTYRHSSKWRDRRVTLESPLFPGYVFVRIVPSERVAVLSVPSVIRILSYRGEPVPVDDAEIDAIRICIRGRASLEPHHFIAIGEKVRVREGAFEGLEGFVVRHHNGCKVVVSISLIHQSVALEIDHKSLEAVKPIGVGGTMQALRSPVGTVATP